jgi:hypothetical protein
MVTLRRKLLAALAAAMMALAVALPASANAATSPPVVPPIPAGIGNFVNSVLCPLLVAETQFVGDTQNVLLANLVKNLLTDFGCGGATG